MAHLKEVDRLVGIVMEATTETSGRMLGGGRGPGGMTVYDWAVKLRQAMNALSAARLEMNGPLEGAHFVSVATDSHTA